MAFEKLLDVQVPRRAEYIRVLSGELNRIASHSLFLGWMALDLGGLTPILWSFIERDEIVDMLAGADRPADAVQLLPHRRRQRRPEPRVHEPPGRLDEPRDRADRGQHRRSSTRTRSSSAGCAASGTIDTDDGAADGHDRARTCARRACPFDVRRAHPYSVYPELDFDIPTRSRGRLPGPLPAAHGRDQAEPADHRPVPAPDARRPGHGQAAAAAAAAPGSRLRRRSRVRAASTPTYVVSDGTDQPFRMRIHDPSFIHLQAVGLMMPGPPHRRHDGDHGLPRPDHGRRRQVRALDGHAALPLRARSRALSALARARLPRRTRRVFTIAIPRGWIG